MSTQRKPYPSDVTDAEWQFLLPYLLLMRESAPQRAHDLREVFNALRYVVKTDCQWRMLPHDLPDWTVAYQQARRWVQAGVFEQVAHDLRVILRLVEERNGQPSAVILDTGYSTWCSTRARAVSWRGTPGRTSRCCGG